MVAKNGKEPAIIREQKRTNKTLKQQKAVQKTDKEKIHAQ
jgi:hypothetical protein